jgi:hypothetical protein
MLELLLKKTWILLSNLTDWRKVNSGGYFPHILISGWHAEVAVSDESAACEMDNCALVTIRMDARPSDRTIGNIEKSGDLISPITHAGRVQLPQRASRFSLALSLLTVHDGGGGAVLLNPTTDFHCYAQGDCGNEYYAQTMAFRRCAC